MTDILELFKGVGVIVDDALVEEKRNSANRDIIWDIEEFFQARHIPLLTYSELPADERIKNLHNISFLLLDWELFEVPEEYTLQGVRGPQGIHYVPNSDVDENENTSILRNIEFINKFKKICFAPIFIFSNQHPNNIIAKLTEAGLYDSAKSNHIFVKHKPDLQNVDLFSEIEQWLKQTPSVYVMKEWEFSLQEAKNSLFWDFYNISPHWVKIFHDTITKDNTSLPHEMGELLFENLKTRCTPVKFNNEIITSQNSNTTISSDEINQVLEGQRFRKKENTPDTMIFTGDVFCKENKYYINVRPQCDCIPREKNQTNDNVKLYLIEGEEIELSNKKDLKFSKKTGVFNDADIEFTIFPIHDKKAIRFKLGQFSVEEYERMKKYRIGTLLPPFITRLVQKYALYMKRQGLPRIPEEALSNNADV